MRFTDKGIAALKAKAERYEVWEDGRTGFGVRVSSRGRKSWIFMYRFGGKARRMTLGNFPRVGLASAGVKLANAKKALDHGEDPGTAARAEKATERGEPTVKELVEEYLSRDAAKKRSHAEIKRVLEKEVVPAWGRRKAKAIRRRDVIELLDAIDDRGAGIMANRTLSYVRRMFNFGIARDIIADNPCWGVEPPGDETERERVLADVEIRSLWNGLASADMTQGLQLATKLILVTAQRPGEVTGAEIAELDLDNEKVWTIPGRRTKNKLEHRVPLSPLAIDLIKTAMAARKRAADGDGPGRIIGEKWLFPSPTGAEPITRRAITRAFSRNGSMLGISDPPAAKDAPARSTPAKEPATPHDLRRTASTSMTELGFTRFIVDRILNHVEPGVGRVYDRYKYDREKRQALDAWAARLDEILAGKKRADGKVVSLRPAAG